MPSRLDAALRRRGTTEIRAATADELPPGLRSLMSLRGELFAVCVSTGGCSRSNQNVKRGQRFRRR
jgi:hypothetical protein